MRTAWVTLLLLLGVPVMVASPAAAATVGPAEGRDTVVIGLERTIEPDSLNWMFATWGPAARILSLLFVEDVVRGADWVARARGVEAIPNVRDGTWRLDGEGMVLRWRIRPRAWHDGRSVTCGDYVFTHRVASDPRVPVVAATAISRRIASVICPNGAGGRDIEVRWGRRTAYAARSITAFGAQPRHVLEPYYRANPSKLKEAPYGLDPRVTIGDGAYRFVRWEKGVSITLESVGSHPILGRPKIRRIIWRVLPEQRNLVQALLSGAIDVLPAPGVRLEFVQPLRERSDAVRLLILPWLFWEHVDLNFDNPLLRDVRVRRALAHAINRREMIQQVSGGLDQISHTYLPPGHPGYTRDVPIYPYDPARARALLEQAGFRPGPDGIRADGTGRRLSLELSTTAGSGLREQMQRIIQRQLREVGIEIVFVNYPARTFFVEVTEHRKFTGLALYTWIMSPTSDCDLLYTSDAIPTAENGWSGENYPGYRSEEMDRVCQAITTEINETRRVALLRESARIFSRDLPALPLSNRVIAVAAKPGLRNFSIGFALDEVPSEVWNAHEWYWE
ncbi:MAG TPA: peptide ABC transporter substrate-binding protein [Gemmatimonadales bacterium]|nr:peptide ABC transporter substrate-binding protein [Gemmatimonadales bacterium]